MDKSTVEALTAIQKLAEHMDDPDFTRAVALVEQVVGRPDNITPKKVAGIISELSALGAKFGLMSSYYKAWGKAGTEERYKKDVYYTARDGVRDVVDSLKYLQRALEGRFG